MPGRRLRLAAEKLSSLWSSAASRSAISFAPSSLGKLFEASRHRSDREFLPAALAILETPPSPIKVGLLWAICLLALFVVAWSYFGRLDILAVAQGKIQPTGRVKTIQPLETGKVLAVHVENGQHVGAGEVLVELDPTEALADEQASRAALAGYRAERLRRRAALDAAEGRRWDAEPRVSWPNDIPDETRSREERVLKGDLAHLKSEIESLDAQHIQKQTEEQRLVGTIAAQEQLVETLKQRVVMRKELLARNSTSKASVIDALEALQYQETQLAAQKGQLKEARAAIDVLTKEREKAFETFVADNVQKLAEAGRQIDEFEQRVAKARARTSHMTLLSPIAGTILGLSVTTTNQVLTASEEVMRIVPDEAGLEIECYLQNKDVGFVQPGQTAVVKLEPFPFIRYGSIDARVVRVGRDAIPEPDAQNIETTSGRAQKSNFAGGAQRVQNLVFPVTLAPSQTRMNVDGADVPLSPGMAVSVEIKTGKRRILEYLFSPLVETASRAMRER